MSVLANKSALALICLPHHQKILIPVLQALQTQGVAVSYTTVAAEAGFEMTLIDAGLPYIHVQEYMLRCTTQIQAAWREVRNEWQARVVKSRWTLQAVPLTIQDKILRSAVENHFCFQALVEDVKPDMVFALHELNSWGKLLGYAAWERNIPFFTFQEGLCYAHPWLYSFYTEYTTKCFCWGEADAQVLIDARCDPDKIVQVGSIDLGPAIKRTQNPDVVSQTRKKFGIDPGMKVVVFLMSNSTYNAVDPTPYFRWCVRNGVATIFKWHPSESKETMDRATTYLRNMPYAVHVQDCDTYALLAMADACVCVGNSTTGIEALAYGKLLVDMPLPGQVYSYWEQGVAPKAEGFTDVHVEIEKLWNEGISAERQSAIQRYLARSFAYQDDKTVGRIVAVVEEVMKDHERHKQNGAAQIEGHHHHSYDPAQTLPL